MDALIVDLRGLDSGYEEIVGEGRGGGIGGGCWGHGQCQDMG